jgi:heme oxygenase
LNDQSTSLAQRLRHETSSQHRQLEASIGFDIHSPDVRAAFGMLRTFYGVLRDLEPAMLKLLPEPIAGGRSKLDLLVSDLQRLGMRAHQIDALGSAPAWLPASPAEAAGAMYVFEGSTLGGKVIVKTLRGLPDWPITGACYFDPYGPQTKGKWKQLQAYLDAMPLADHDSVVRAAQLTFSMLDAQIQAQREIDDRSDARSNR